MRRNKTAPPGKVKGCDEVSTRIGSEEFRNRWRGLRRAGRWLLAQLSDAPLRGADQNISSHPAKLRPATGQTATTTEKDGVAPCGLFRQGTGSVPSFSLTGPDTHAFHCNACRLEEEQAEGGIYGPAPFRLQVSQGPTNLQPLRSIHQDRCHDGRAGDIMDQTVPHLDLIGFQVPAEEHVRGNEVLPPTGHPAFVDHRVGHRLRFGLRLWCHKDCAKRQRRKNSRQIQCVKSLF
jgi:hypothetical protein